MIKPQIKCKNTSHVNKALVQCTALTKEVIKHSAGWLVQQIWLAAYQIISQWAQPSWNLTSNKRGSLLGFLPSRNPNSSVYWRNRVGDHMPKYQQPYISSPTVFITTGNYAKVVHSEGPVPWAAAKLSKQFDSAAERITALLIFLLTFSFLKCWAVKSYHFTCLSTGIWITSTAQQLNNSPSQQLSSNRSSACLTYPWAAFTKESRKAYRVLAGS